MRYWTDEETGMPLCEPNCADEWLHDIWAIGLDYDGYSTVEGLKSLVDELVEMSQKARQCLREGKIYSQEQHPYVTKEQIKKAQDNLRNFLYNNNVEFETTEDGGLKFK